MKQPHHFVLILARHQYLFRAGFECQRARFFALLTTASSDALIACWDSKFFYSF
jgi:hypothetical protein